MKKILTLSVLTIMFNISSFADCLSCWELKYVRVILNNNEEIKGYVKWNNVWYLLLEERNMEIAESFPENFIEYYKYINDGKRKIDIYKNIYKIGNTQKWASYFYIQNDLKQVTIDMIKKIEKIENEIDNIQGAQNLANFGQEIIDFLDKEPFNVETYDDGGCVFNFINFNTSISRDKLKEMISSGFYKKEKEFELKKIFILKQCYD